MRKSSVWLVLALLLGALFPGGTCAGKPCWKPLGGSGGYRYRNRAGTPDGVTSMKLRVTQAGELQLVVKGKGVHLPMPSLGLVTPVRAQLLVGDDAATTCWESSFDSAVKNDAIVFKANGS